MKKKEQNKEVKGLKELTKEEMQNINGGKRLVLVYIDGEYVLKYI